MSMTPRAEVGPALPCSHRSHIVTEMTLLFRVPSINGIENERSEWEATQIQPLTNAGSNSGKMMRRRMAGYLSPEICAASSNSRCI